MEIKGKLGNLTPAVLKNPEPMASKFGVVDDVGDTYPCAKVTRPVFLVLATPYRECPCTYSHNL